MLRGQPRQVVAEDHVVPRLVGVDEGVTQLRMMRERELQHREIRHAPGSGADVDDVIGLRPDVRAEGIRAGEAGHHEAHAPERALDEQRRQQRRELGRSRDVALFLDGDREVALMRRRAHRVGPRRLPLPLQVFQERGETLERLELVRVDRQEVARQVFKAIVAGEQHQGGGIRRLDDDVGDHHFHLFDAARSRLHPGSVCAAARKINVASAPGL